MSYDPFAAPQSHQHQQPYNTNVNYAYGQSTSQPHYDSHSTPYRDVAEINPAAPYDPHSVPYKDEAVLPPGTMADKEFDLFQPPPKSTGDLRMWRHDHHGNLWTRGGRGRCVGRFCCCTIMITFLIFVSIVLTLATFLRPPDIQFSGIVPSTAANSVVSTPTTLNANLGIGISVRNPNYFSVTMKSIKLNVTYPINNTQIGGGVENNIVFKSNSKTSFSFPFLFVYSQSSDPQGLILTDMATKCGFLPGTQKQQLSVGYTLTLAIQVLSVTISPPFSGNTKFDCPFTLADIQPLMGAVPGLAALLNGTSGIP